MAQPALLNEGEVAEIITHHSGDGHSRTHRHKHHPEQRDGHCGGDCANCSCRGKAPASLSIVPDDHLQSMGLRPGKPVEMIKNSGRDPLVPRVDESRDRPESWNDYLRPED